MTARPGRAARVLLAAAGGGLLLAGPATPAHADDDSPPATESRGAAFSLIDNSHADSWLEVDRTLDQEVGAGTAGSDHDGPEVRVRASPASGAAIEGAPAEQE